MYRAIPQTASAAAQLTKLEAPPGQSDAGCTATRDQVWRVDATELPADRGVGFLVNPAVPGYGQFVIHDHIYQSAYVPKPDVRRARCRVVSSEWG